MCVCTESNSIYFKRLKQIIPLPEFRIARNLRAHIFTDHYLYSGPEYCSLEGPGFEFRWARGFPHPSRLVLTLSLPYNVYWISFSGVSRLGYGVEHQPPPIAEVKERKELYLYSLAVSSWRVIGWNVRLHIYHRKDLLVLENSRINGLLNSRVTFTLTKWRKLAVWNFSRKIDRHYFDVCSFIFLVWLVGREEKCYFREWRFGFLKSVNMRYLPSSIWHHVIQ